MKHFSFFRSRTPDTVRLAPFASPLRFPGRWVAVTVLLILFLSPRLFSEDRDSRFLTVGAASEEITPETPVMLGGYASRTRPHEGVRSPIWTRVLYLADGERRLLWSVSDLIGFKPEDATRIRGLLAERTGIMEENILISVTHTHSAPATAPIGSPKETAYLDGFFLPRLLRAAESAIAGSEPCSLTATVGTSNLAHDRRNDPFPGDGGAPNPDRMKGVTDNRVPAVAFKRADGTVKAVLLEYAMHPTSWNDQKIGAEWPGAAADAIHRVFGAETEPIILQGAAGNVGSPQRHAPPEEIAHWGETLVSSVAETLRTRPPEESPRFAFESEEIVVENRRMTIEEIHAEADRLRNQFKNRPDLVEFTINPWEQTLLAHWSNETGSSETGMFTAVALAGHLFITTPFETFAHLNRELGRRVSFPVFVVGYTNGVFQYFPSADAFTQGGYEPNAYIWFGQFPLKPGSLEKLADDLIPLLERVEVAAVKNDQGAQHP